MSDKLSRREFIETLAKSAALAGLTIAPETRRVFASPSKFDLVIKNGMIVDGMGNEPFESDLGIIGEYIQAIEKVDPSQAKKVIDASKKIVSPGFIDIHSHSDFEPFLNPKAESKIRQGVTTELVGNCGSSAFPLKKSCFEDEEEILKEAKIEITWENLEGYHLLLEKRGIAVNHGTLVGQGTVRRFIIGNARRKPSTEEMEMMKKLVSDAMSQGAFGLSTGLEYIPDRFSSTDEIIELCKVIADFKGFYATHMRSEDTFLLEAVGEALHISESACLPLQISHLKASGKENYYKIPFVFDLIERAKERGLDVSADRYPYTAYSTTLSISFPAWALDGGPQCFVERLKDRELREKMKEETMEKVVANNGWESMLINHVQNEKNRHLIGKYIQEAADEVGQDPYEFACDLLISEGGNLSITGFGMSEENTASVLKHPQVMLCSDGSALAPYGPLDRGIPHPRNYGTFPRFLKVYVREKKILTLTEAIQKMTSMPARRMGLRDRGAIKKGFYADLVIFDLSRILDKATYTDPKQYPEGIDYVIVNGKVVISKGEHSGELPGKILRHKKA